MSLLERMTLEVSLLVAFVLVLSLAALAQADMKDRATTALGSVNTGGAIFDATRMQNTATAFQAPAPPEAAITPLTIQSETIIRLGGHRTRKPRDVKRAVSSSYGHRSG